MKITERMRRKFALDIIQEISADAQSTDPIRDWERSQKAVCYIYQIVHTILAPKCRKNHPKWTKFLDREIRSISKYK